ncbi:MAG: TRAP transporter small permease, partial [Candidatus Eremiobacteraeota bacterium]|nr:TRAP transporter small permease [Candidatus Eremiobacteraeota bacterium]
MTIARIIDGAAEAILVAALLGELAVVLANVVGRTLSQTGFLWAPEVSQFALSTMTFVGGAVAYRRGQHTPVRAVLVLLPKRGQVACSIVADWLVVIGALVAGAAAITLVRNSWVEITPILRLPAGTIALPLVIAMALLVLYAAERLAKTDRRLVSAIGLSVAGVLALAIATRSWWQPAFHGDAAMYAALALLLVMVLAGLPVGFALLLATVGYLWLAAGAPILALAHN